MQIRCSKCHGTGMYASRFGPFCFECRGQGVTDISDNALAERIRDLPIGVTDPRDPRDLGLVAVKLAVTKDGTSWFARTAADVPHDAPNALQVAKMDRRLTCFASFAHGIAATRTEALAALGADLRQRGLTGVLKVVQVREVDEPHRDPLSVAVEANRNRAGAA